MLFRLHLILLTAAGALAAQDAAATGSAHSIQDGSHAAVWIDDGAPHNWTSSMSLHGADIRFEGPPVTDAPYSAEAVTEVVQTLADGNRIRHENRTKIYRDSEGRTRREEKLQPIGPWSRGPSNAEMIFISDPVAGVHWIVNPQEKTARKMPAPRIQSLKGVVGNTTYGTYSETLEVTEEDGKRRKATIKRHIEHSSSSTASEHPPRTRARSVVGTLAGNTLMGPAAGGEVETEQLGERTIEGVIATGLRRTRTIKAGQIGNERPIEVVFEQWRSEELGVTVKSIRSDPRSGVTTYKLENIQRTNPLPTLFEPPADYEVIEMPAFAKLRELNINKEQAPTK